VNPHMRVANAERDRACDILREHFAVGRLSKDELTMRVAAAQSAVRWADLQELFADLPPIPGMQLVYNPSPHVPAPAHWQPAPTHGPSVPATRSTDSAQMLRVAAWVCVGLGLFTFGITLIPAIIFGVAAYNTGPNSRSPERRTDAVLIIGVVLAIILVLVGLAAAISL
jgi:hypothetical protein